MSSRSDAFAVRTSCSQGHLFTPENTYVPPGTQVRRCRTCQRQWDAERKERALRGGQIRWLPKRSIAERFWSRVNVTDECWTWAGPLNQCGYGASALGDRIQRGAHRVAYMLGVGPIPEGLEIDHVCFNRACVRPDHLEAVTHAENVRRAAARRRAATGATSSTIIEVLS